METPKDSPAACEVSSAPDCWAVAILLRKTTYEDSKAIETLRLISAWCEAASKNEAIGKCADDMLAQHEGFALANIVATMIPKPNTELTLAAQNAAKKGNEI